MPKYLWRPYRRAVKDLEYYKELEDRLIEKTGFDMVILLESLDAGWVLQPPDLTGERRRLLEAIYDSYPDAFDRVQIMSADPDAFDRVQIMSADEVKRVLELSEQYYQEPTIMTDKNGQMRITEVSIVKKGEE